MKEAGETISHPDQISALEQSHTLRFINEAQKCASLALIGAGSAGFGFYDHSYSLIGTLGSAIITCVSFRGAKISYDHLKQLGRRPSQLTPPPNASPETKINYDNSK